MEEQPELVRSLAVRWMLGTRQGSNRPAWKHPEDVATLTQELPGKRTLYTQHLLEAVAWGHDLLEDGVQEDGTRVTSATLQAHRVNDLVLIGIHDLSKWPGVEKASYIKQVREAAPFIQIVKCCDRIANLTEGVDWFKDRRWARYAAETKDWILPMAEALDAPEGPWLAGELTRLLNSRPV
jgi:(p)ppGpp synthase/HD superfamily hydrolase